MEGEDFTIIFLKKNRTYIQNYNIKIWEEAFLFFGPCRFCGQKDLQFLSISHIRNDGAEKRRNGETTGVGLLKKFRKMGWPESLKEDYCLECFNCNCSKRTNLK